MVFLTLAKVFPKASKGFTRSKTFMLERMNEVKVKLRSKVEGRVSPFNNYCGGTDYQAIHRI